MLTGYAVVLAVVLSWSISHLPARAGQNPVSYSGSQTYSLGAETWVTMRFVAIQSPVFQRYAGVLSPTLVLFLRNGLAFPTLFLRCFAHIALWPPDIVNRLPCLRHFEAGVHFASVGLLRFIALLMFRALAWVGAPWWVTAGCI